MHSLHSISIRLKITACLVAAFMLLLGHQAKATHIRAGEITAKRVNDNGDPIGPGDECSGLTYEFTIAGYEDTGSNVVLGPGTIDFGDGTFGQLDMLAGAPEVDNIGADTRIKRFTITHTFSAPGAYLVRFQEFNRNEGVLNMLNSGVTPFYVETLVIIDPAVGCNNTPLLLAPPIDRASLGLFFIHNPAAFDPDGDSLSYHLAIPQQDLGLPVNNYQFPNDWDIANIPGVTREASDSLPTLILDSIVGDLVWDAPGAIGEYNVAFTVAEWRKIQGEYFLLGYVTRDMQIIVEDANNERPTLAIPNDTCIMADTSYAATITGDDPDGDNVKLEAFGGVFELSTNPAVFSFGPPEFQPVEAEADFDWDVSCFHVRERPYEVRFKISDDPPFGQVSLVDFETWQVTVVGPPPTGLETELLANRRVRLTWDPYRCPNAESMLVWRRVGSFSFDTTGCNIGIPDFARYEVIDTVDINTLSYIDEGGGNGLNIGADYCYRLTAIYPFPTGGTSYASNEACQQLAVDAPAITHVDVLSTEEETGQIFVRWTSPLEADTLIAPPPFRYELYRGQGFVSDSVDRQFLLSTADTVFTDSGLNTQDSAFNYIVYFYDANDDYVGSSASASSHWLTAIPRFQGIELRWEGVVPWGTQVQESPYHYIYRNRVGDPDDADNLVLIDSAQVNSAGFRYIDDGSFNDEPLDDELEYCYYVTTVGSYNNPLIPGLLLNKTQEACAEPNDTIPPCPPPVVSLSPDNCAEELADKPCGYQDFTITLDWEDDESGECQADDISFYRVYYSRTGEDDTFEAVAITSTPTFEDDGRPDLAGCYFITAVDRSGNESQPSNVVCSDNCPFIDMPNAFSPNDDGVNDTFGPFNNEHLAAGQPNRCPRFVKSISMVMVNRWGTEVFRYESGGENSIFINWDGTLPSGEQASTGTYFYVIDVEYNVRNPAGRSEKLKGYVNLLR